MSHYRNIFNPAIICLSLLTVIAGLMICPEVAQADHGVTVNTREAEVEDVLNILAMKSGKNIIYVGEEETITFKVENKPVMTALELLLQKAGMDYLQEGDLIIVGSEGKLHDDFFNQRSITRFDLNHVVARQVEPLISDLDIPVQTISLEENPGTLWAQGVPQGLTKLRELINAVDRRENAPRPGESPEDPDDEYFISDYKQVTLKRIAPSRARELLADMGVSIDSYIILRDKLLVFDPVIQDHWESFEQVIQEIDTADARRQHAFFYQLDYISTEDAARLVREFQFDGVTIADLNLPEFNNELLLLVPPHKEDEVRRAIDSIDVQRDKTRATITSATGENARSELSAKRTLLSEMTDVSASEMVISGNLSGDDDNPHHVLWIEHSPNTITKLQNLVDSF